MEPDVGVLQSIGTPTPLISLISQLQNATFLFAFACAVAALALGRYLAVARLHRLALIAYMSPDAEGQAKARIRELVARRLRSFDQSFVDRHRLTSRPRKMMFLAGSLLALVALAGVFIWVAFVSATQMLPAAAAALVESLHYSLAGSIGAIALAIVVIVILSLSFGFIAYAGIQIIERARPVYSLLNNCETLEPQKINRYDLSVMSIGVFGPIVAVALLVVVFLTQDRYGEYRGKVVTMLGSYAAVIESDDVLTSEQAEKLEAGVVTEFEIQDVDPMDASLIRGAVVESYFRRMPSGSVAKTAHVVAHVLRATGDDPDAIREEVVAMASSYGGREMTKRRGALRKAAGMFLTRSHKDGDENQLDPMEVRRLMYGDPLGADDESIASLKAGDLTKFLNVMAAKYYDSAVWKSEILPLFPDWSGSARLSEDNYDDQDVLAAWVEMNASRLRWSRAERQYKITRS
jgi:hypothetical protein